MISFDRVIKIVEASAAAIVAGIAIWGFFFSDIPDALIRQLQQDVVSAREDLVRLEEERKSLLLQGEMLSERNRQLESSAVELQRSLSIAQAKLGEIEGSVQLQRAEADTLRDKINVLIEERSILESDMQVAQTSLANIQEELTSANQKRRLYLRSAVKLEIASLVDDLNRGSSYFSEVSDRAQEIRDYPIWIREEEELQNELAKLDDPRDQRDLIERHHRRRSGHSWMIFNLSRWETDATSLNERLEQSESMVIECVGRYPDSAISWLLSNVENRGFSLLFIDDAKRLRRTLISEIKKHEGDLRYSPCIQQAALTSGDRISADVARVDRVISSIKSVVSDISEVALAPE